MGLEHTDNKEDQMMNVFQALIDFALCHKRRATYGFISNRFLTAKFIFLL
jgi:hypothetical protein